MKRRVKKTENPGKTHVMVSKSKSYAPPTEHEIACCAYAIYSQEEPYRARELWHQAEAQLIASRKHDAGLLRSAVRCSTGSNR